MFSNSFPVALSANTPLRPEAALLTLQISWILHSKNCLTWEKYHPTCLYHKVCGQRFKAEGSSRVKSRKGQREKGTSRELHTVYNANIKNKTTQVLLWKISNILTCWKNFTMNCILTPIVYHQHFLILGISYIYTYIHPSVWSHFNLLVIPF